MSRRSLIENCDEHLQEKLNQLKYQLCKAIEYEIYRIRLTQYRAAVMLGTSQANVSRVVRKRTDQLTFNQLFRYLIILKPDVVMAISTY